jgi:UDP-2,4-diacetamido-2,4,6-trideoxy-beta-L-altropyranose hydrolase
MLALRADANARIGAGHVLRALALGQAARRAGDDAVLIAADIPKPLVPRFTSCDIPIIRLEGVHSQADDAQQTLAAMRAHHADWVAVDSYLLSPRYRRTLRTAGARVLWLCDEPPRGPCDADIVLNGNPLAHEAVQCESAGDAHFLLGAEYLPLRQEFTEVRPRSISGAGTRVLVTLGGADPVGATERVLGGLRAIGEPRLELTALSGPLRPGARPPRDVDARGTRTRWVHDPPDVATLMSQADLAVTAAGSTGWELACTGTPAMTIVTAENQANVASALARAGAAENLGRMDDLTERQIADAAWRLLRDADRRRSMSCAGRRLVDGRGASRVIAYVRSLTHASASSV